MNDHIVVVVPDTGGTRCIFVIVLEKRSNFAVKLIFQYEPLKLVTLVDFVHNSECLN